MLWADRRLVGTLWWHQLLGMKIQKRDQHCNSRLYGCHQRCHSSPLYCFVFLASATVPCMFNFASFSSAFSTFIPLTIWQGIDLFDLVDECLQDFSNIIHELQIIKYEYFSNHLPLQGSLCSTDGLKVLFLLRPTCLHSRCKAHKSKIINYFSVSSSLL